MINKLIADRFLDLPAFDQQPPPHPDPNFPADFVLVPDRTYSIQESTSHGSIFSGRHKVSQVQVGAHGGKAHRSFRWLPWIPGKVSCMRLAGADILTGRMSGCWLTTFTFNGTRYAGHIGTLDNPGSAGTLQARAAWRNAMADYAITSHAAFNPVAPEQLRGDLNLGRDGAEFYGAWGGGNQYTVVLGALAGNPQRRRICRVIQAPRSLMDVTAF